ncbi:UNVERIFIED_CONTAM: hypothetical protein HHA_279310 [Hammondia hammondi]|eukprot:XP_008887713.1 hypothetical protein HHA_279310 [Hammondia hammondi]
MERKAFYRGNAPTPSQRGGLATCAVERQEGREEEKTKTAARKAKKAADSTTAPATTNLENVSRTMINFGGATGDAATTSTRETRARARVEETGSHSHAVARWSGENEFDEEGTEGTHRKK